MNNETEKELKEYKFPPKNSKTNETLLQIGIMFATIAYIYSYAILSAIFKRAYIGSSVFAAVLPYALIILAAIFVLIVFVLIPSYIIEYVKYKKGEYSANDFESDWADDIADAYIKYSIYILFLSIAVFLFISARMRF